MRLSYLLSVLHLSGGVLKNYSLKHFLTNAKLVALKKFAKFLKHPLLWTQKERFGRLLNVLCTFNLFPISERLSRCLSTLCRQKYLRSLAFMSLLNNLFSFQSFFFLFSKSVTSLIMELISSIAQYGIAKPFYFPFTRSYWIGSCKKTTIKLPRARNNENGYNILLNESHVSFFTSSDLGLFLKL